ncbi:MAG: hypothetical protein ABIH04_03475 [Planctomycetota bacterium]
MSMIIRVLSITAAGICVAILGGCYGTAKIWVEEGPGEPLHPMFSTNRNVTSLMVYSLDQWPPSDNNSDDYKTRQTVTWFVSLDGGASETNRIVYGRVPPDYKEWGKAQPLEPEKIYFVHIANERQELLTRFFYFREDDSGQTRLISLTPYILTAKDDHDSRLNWVAGRRSFKEVNIVIDEYTREILQVIAKK